MELGLASSAATATPTSADGACREGPMNALSTARAGRRPSHAQARAPEPEHSERC